jgi:FkbM family methyltransferase
MTVARELRYMARGAVRRLRPSPAEAARRRLEREAQRVPRHTPGRIGLMDLDIEYADALPTVPQWDDLFVRETLAFVPGNTAPRILDCGANIGLASLWLTGRFPDARVTAFEPDPALCAILRRNLRVNGRSRVEVVAAAVWSAKGRLPFRPDGADSGALAAVTMNEGGAAIEVDAERLREWIAREPIDLLKLDVEGAELDVLRDCADVLGRVGALHVEVHDFAVGERRLPACLDLLHRAGFACTLAELHQATWRMRPTPAGPFPGVADWVVLVKAWPADRR